MKCLLIWCTSFISIHHPSTHTTQHPLSHIHNCRASATVTALLCSLLWFLISIPSYPSTVTISAFLFLSFHIPFDSLSTNSIFHLSITYHSFIEGLPLPLSYVPGWPPINGCSARMICDGMTMDDWKMVFTVISIGPTFNERNFWYRWISYLIFLSSHHCHHYVTLSALPPPMNGVMWLDDVTS